ncbi:unnamed protein product [Amaranthus hypochondriacus]
MEFPQMQSQEFDFNSGRSSPCVSSPSTPKGFPDYHFNIAPFLTPPRNFDVGIKNPLLSPQQSPNTTRKVHHNKSFWSAFSPKRKKDTQSDQYNETIVVVDRKARKTKQKKETERVSRLSNSSHGRRTTRSLSPLRSKYYLWEDEEQQNTKQFCSLTSRKWKLKDLLLFRSASEGRASDKDPLKMYSYMMQKQHEVVKSVSLSQSTIEGSPSATPKSRKGRISAHELHYTVNKAISQDMKKKSFLPYKQGILGRLAFNPTVHALAHGSY